jgi:regulator of PEP synthase PpsR (kinase-PPPase family)
MIYALILLTAAGPQNVDSYASIEQCRTEAREWQAQQIKAGCVPQKTTEQAIIEMQSYIKMFEDSLK